MEKEALKFKVIGVYFQNATLVASDDADFFLEQDDWNDFGYYTTYHLHATANITKKQSQYLGVIKILKVGQKEHENRVLSKELQSKKLPLVFTQLPPNFYSISFSLELYRGLNKYLSDRQCNLFVRSMRMILDIQSDYYRKVEKENVFTTSFLRDASMNSDVLKRGKLLLHKRVDLHNWEEQTLTVTFSNATEPITLDFSRIKNTDDIINPPSGVIAFIGHNGCGKSTSLYQIAKILFASPSDRWIYKDQIKVEPKSVGINKLLFFSYSAFDNFILPGITLSDYRLISDGLEDNKGRFVFCGIRDVKAEMDEHIMLYEKEREKSGKENTGDFLAIDRLDQNHRGNIKLKKIDTLADERVKTYSVIKDSKNKQLNILLSEIILDSKTFLPSLFDDTCWLLEEIAEDELKQLIMKKSTGVKFFIHSLLHLIAYTEENSIVLFDEPENHLHPPFLSFMMKSFRRIIHNKHSVMLVATHSPIILQETLSKNVFILRKDDKSLLFSKPHIETYGESFGLINSYVFNLNTDITSYHSTIDLLYNKWDCQDLESSSEILNRFKTRLGIESLSSQLEVYILNKYYESHVES